MSTPIPPGHLEKPAWFWGMGTGSIPSCVLFTALGPLLANLLVRLVQLGTAWPHWPGAAPPGQILFLVVAKGCQAGWIQKTHMANFIWTQAGPSNSDKNSAVHSLC